MGEAYDEAHGLSYDGGMSRDDREHWETKYAAAARRRRAPAPFSSRTPTCCRRGLHARSGSRQRTERALPGRSRASRAWPSTWPGAALAHVRAADRAGGVRVHGPRHARHPARARGHRDRRQLPRPPAVRRGAAVAAAGRGAPLGHVPARAAGDRSSAQPGLPAPPRRAGASPGGRLRRARAREGLVEEPSGRAFRSGVVARRRRNVTRPS